VTLPPTHRGPDGPCHARAWSGTNYESIAGFLNGPANVAFWFSGFSPLRALHLDLEGGTVQTAHPGDYVVWAAGHCHIVRCARFITEYRPIRKQGA
jgi:hypothetical protein